eukprot:GDKJ01001370.1.p1 GENE.GDKJ01001370.1~~GDKJ01001370.1.p1  ORF type:complete len:207 (-),score=31.75 GDKJ01001370.1:126-746(-)
MSARQGLQTISHSISMLGIFALVVVLHLMGLSAQTLEYGLPPMIFGIVLNFCFVSAFFAFFTRKRMSLILYAAALLASMLSCAALIVSFVLFSEKTVKKSIFIETVNSYDRFNKLNDKFMEDAFPFTLSIAAVVFVFNLAALISISRLPSGYDRRDPQEQKSRSSVRPEDEWNTWLTLSGANGGGAPIPPPEVPTAAQTPAPLHYV